MSATSRRTLASSRVLGLAPPVAVTIGAANSVVWVGDSITSTAYDAYAAAKTTIDAHFTGLGQTPPTHTNSGVSGSGLLDGTAMQWGDPASVTTYVTPYNPHVLFVALGVNDMTRGGVVWNVNTWRTRLRAFIARCLATCPRLTIRSICLSSPWFCWGEPVGTNETEGNQCLMAGMDVASLVGCCYLDTRTTRSRAGGRTVDGTHPTTTGKSDLSTALLTVVAYG